MHDRALSEESHSGWKARCERQINWVAWKDFWRARAWGGSCEYFCGRQISPRIRWECARPIDYGPPHMPKRPYRIISMAYWHMRCSKACPRLVCLMRAAGPVAESVICPKL